MTRKGLSPIVGAVLLIAVIMAAGAIIFIWASGFIVDLGPVGLECDDVNFEAGIFSNALEIVNRGNVDIFGFEIKLIEDGRVVVKETIDSKIKAGGSGMIDLVENYASGDELLIIPIVEEGFVCDDGFGKEVLLSPEKAVLKF